jgi:hypothetical protein
LVSFSEARTKWFPSDDAHQRALRDVFLAHREAFETLATMSKSDGNITRIASDFTWLAANSKWPRDEIGFSQERWAAYKDLFTELGLTEGLLRSEDEPGKTYIIATARGLCTSGNSEGYVYADVAPAPESDDLPAALYREASAHADRHEATVYQHLDGNWYLFYRADW